MSFEDREIDDEKLMDEIDKLDTDYSINNEESKTNKIPKKKKKINENVVFIILLLVVLMAYILYEKVSNSIEQEVLEYKTSEQNEDLEKITLAKFENMKKNINIISKSIGANGDIIICLENKNDEPVYEFEVYAIFCDGDGDPVEIRSSEVYYLDPSGQIYLEFESVSLPYETYNILITKDHFLSKPINMMNNIEYKSFKEGDTIILEGTNNSDVKIEVARFQIVFFDEKGDALGVNTQYVFDLNRNKTFREECNKLYDKEYNEIEYSSYKVILEYAY